MFLKSFTKKISALSVACLLTVRFAFPVSADNATKHVIANGRYSFFADFFWEAIKNSDGSYSFKSKETVRSNGKEMMLDLENGNTNNGTQAMVWQKNSARSQNWKLTKVPTHNTNCVSMVHHSLPARVVVTNNCGNAVNAKANINNAPDSGMHFLNLRNSFTHNYIRWGGGGTQGDRVEARWAR